MIKRVILFIIVLNFLLSCGKKGDLEYKESLNSSHKQEVIVQ